MIILRSSIKAMWSLFWKEVISISASSFQNRWIPLKKKRLKMMLTVQKNIFLLAKRSCLLKKSSGRSMRKFLNWTIWCLRILQKQNFSLCKSKIFVFTKDRKTLHLLPKMLRTALPRWSWYMHRTEWEKQASVMHSNGPWREKFNVFLIWKSWSGEAICFFITGKNTKA